MDGDNLMGLSARRLMENSIFLSTIAGRMGASKNRLSVPIVVPSFFSLPSDAPDLDALNFEFFSLLAQPLVTESHGGSADSALQHLIKPQAVLSIPSANTQVGIFAEDQVVVDTRVREGFETDTLFL